ncbi:MAG: hypothetical protein AB7N65_26265 [Vicinamibacterales bacterium]
MDPRTRWQTLHGHLAQARVLLDSGEPSRALPLVEAALRLDPDFLAAHALRDSVLSASPREFPPEQPVSPTPADLWLNPAAQLADRVNLLHPDPEAARTRASSPAPSHTPAVTPAAPPAVEAKARRRRAARCLKTANERLASGQLEEAAAALAEARELTPDDSAIRVFAAVLAAQQQAVAVRTRAPRGGRVLAGSLLVVLAGTVMLTVARRASAPPDSAIVAHGSRQDVVLLPAADATRDVAPTKDPDSALVAPDPPFVATEAPARASVRTPPARPGGPPRRERPFAPPEESRPRASEPAADLPPPVEMTVPSVSLPSLFHDVPPADSTLPPVSPPAALGTRPLTPSGPSVGIPPPTVDEERLVRAALQKYRAAYDRLDAASAQTVWPDVDAHALARAFADLSTQQLRFEACTLDVQGGNASATCRGSARFVPKVGGREPRIEPRIWTFSLQKRGAEWFIKTSRVRRP